MKKGSHLSEDHKRKISLAKMGHIGWNRGKHISKEHIQKLVEVNKGNKYCLGKHPSLETLKKMSDVQIGEKNGFFGKHHSDEIKLKISLANKGRTSPNKGKHLSNETRERISKSLMGHLSWNKGTHLSATLGTHRSEETKRRISLSNLGRKSPFEGKHHSEEVRKKLSELHKGEKNHMFGKLAWNSGKIGKEDSRILFGERNPMFGTTMSEDKKKRISESLKGNIPWNKGKIGSQMAWNKGKQNIYSDETLRKMSQNQITSWTEERREIVRETNRKRVGEKSPRWLGGKSFEPYTLDFNNKFRESIRERDNYCCSMCNKPQEELGYKLSVHHIGYDKLSSFPQTCISLCRPCHVRTNANRHSWTIFFQDLLKERYGYQYTQDQKIILDFTNKE